MLTRRNFLTGVIATGILRRSRSSFAKASQPATPENFDIPPHACDCHTHIFGDLQEFPLPSTRPYTPEATPPEEMSALHRALHMERVVIVTAECVRRRQFRHPLRHEGTRRERSRCGRN